MSANIDTMLYVREVPWHQLGTNYLIPPKTSEEIIAGAQLDWEVAALPMFDELHQHIPNYHSIYRQDNDNILGVVNRRRPVIVQNRDTFQTFDFMLDSSVDVDTAASLGGGETVFGCFKVREQYKILDDDIDHYFVVCNNHLEVDGKITVLNTPIRVVCQNTLAAAMSKNTYKVRIPITGDASIHSTQAINLLNGIEPAIGGLRRKAETMYGNKITDKYVEIVLDELFPFVQVEGESLTHNKTNENIAAVRDAFLSDCMGADDLGNYRGTQYQMLQALLDFDQHMFKKVDHAYDLNQRMKKLPGVIPGTEATYAVKFLKIADKISV